MARRIGYVATALAIASLLAAAALRRSDPFGPTVGDFPASAVVEQALLVTAVVLFTYGVYRLALVIGFAITFALQQPLLSLMGWVYIVLKQPYRVGDRVKIEDAKGDVIDVDFLVTTLWEINGELVSTHQPSGRLVTVPNSVGLSKEVYNYSWEEFPFV